jgi:type II secretory pathway pseudopilin PulG
VTQRFCNLSPDRVARRGGAGGAFTLAELIIGLLLLAIIGSATAALATAVTRGWQVEEGTVSSTLTITRTMLRIQDKIQRAKSLGQFRAGSLTPAPTSDGAALLFWRDDANGDGEIQFNETQLLEHDPLNNTLLLWETAFTGPFTKAMLNEPNAIGEYKLLPHAGSQVMTRGVLGAAFTVITPPTASQRQTFEFRLKFSGPNGQAVEYGTASPRSPS